ncbi:hypothetical protein Ciccas_012387 [Cichlidogyrus casuarinus]|uniref:long-chain-fatty-acid--CoA ligase n=1 Tax=Cichlidogyrus casuarinus TaxID=1844966 RepID=A0ABD2PRJ9_9PLAT
MSSYLFSLLGSVLPYFGYSAKTTTDNSLRTIAIDGQANAREYNQDYVPHCPSPGKPLVMEVHSSLLTRFQVFLERNPDENVFGSHEKPTDPYQWISYKQFSDIFTEFGAGLKAKFDIEPNSQTNMGIYSANCVEWMGAHFGMLFYSNVAVPIYNTLGEAAIVHIVKLTEMKLCVCFDETKASYLLDILLKSTNDSTCVLKNLVLMRSQSAEKLKQLKDKYPSFNFCTMTEVRDAGRQNPLPYQFPSDDSKYVINFTSGTTGIPKGVIITCGMIKYISRSCFGFRKSDMNSEHSVEEDLRWTQRRSPEDLYFSFLPLAHVLEQAVMYTCLMNGVKIAFFSGDITKLMEEISIVRPTMMALVPRLLIRIYDAAMEKFAAARIPKFLINWAISSKLESTKAFGTPIRNTIWDRLFFGRLQQTLGGRLRFALTGSSACPKDVLDFARASFGAIIHQGYGSTETGGAVCLTLSNDTDALHTGPIIAGAQVKLGDVPDMDLFPSRDPKLQRGEVLVKSPGCTRGYYKAPDKTRELFDSEGWLKTGDVGEWDEFGNLRIVDRCKNLFKLSQGEYVAPEKVEGVYATCPLVVQSFLDGRSESSYAIALVHPNLERLAARIGNPGTTMEAICNNPEATKLVLNELDTLGRSKGLSGFELAKKIKLITEPFTVENGLVTATLKPIRAKIREHFAKEIDVLYSSS